MDIKEIAAKLRERLNKYEGFKGLYVYGSRVYGTPEPHSDLDMVAVFEERLNYEKSLDVTGEALDISIEYDVVIEMFKMTEEELNLNYTFYNEVKRGLFYGAK